jgi:hypothetical protein
MPWILRIFGKFTWPVEILGIVVAVPYRGRRQYGQQYYILVSPTSPDSEPSTSDDFTV